MLHLLSTGCLFGLLLASTASAQWTRHTIDNTSRGADGIRQADFNGDGAFDLVTGWEEGGRVRIYQNPGPGHVRRPWPKATIGDVKSPEDALLADLDGDGRLDAVSCCEGRTRSVFVHWSPDDPLHGDWQTAAVPVLAERAQWMFAAAANVDDRHGPDLVVGAKGSGAQLGWLQSPAMPRRLEDWRWHPLADVGWMMSIIVCDLNDDGRQDILYSDRKGPARGIHWLEHPGPGRIDQRWTRHTVGATDREVMFLCREDLDGDGTAEVVANVRGGDIAWFRPTGDVTAPWSEHRIRQPSGIGTGKGIAVFDVDLDGRQDVVFTCENAQERHGVGWLSAPADLTAADWSFQSISGRSEGIKFDLIQAMDLDGDGDLDLLTCEERDNLGVIWYENPTRGG